MQIKVIGSHCCPDTLYALNQLAAAGAEIDFVDILASHADLKQYLASGTAIRCTLKSGAPNVWGSPAS